VALPCAEEGWTGLIELIVGHYGFEAEEEALVIFVGVVPVVIDVFFKSVREEGGRSWGRDGGRVMWRAGGIVCVWGPAHLYTR
jgi:hypothetical protein